MTTTGGPPNRAPSSKADVCIVGAGPAGALTAHRLAEQGHDVVVLEAGEWFSYESRPERMERHLRPAHYPLSVWDMDKDRDEFTSSGDVFYPVNDMRVKGVGGSSLHWGGRVARFPRKDFEMDTRYGVAPDWPFGYEELRPYYLAAELEMGVAGTDDNPFGPPRKEPYPMEAFAKSYSDTLYEESCEKLDIVMHTVPNARNSEAYDGRSPCVGFGTCTPVCPSGAKYSADTHARKAQKNGARIIDKAVVQKLEHDSAAERVRSVVYETPTGETYEQEADMFVLAAGGVENPRLLLLSSSDDYPSGLANSSGAVGKYFMEHIYVGIVGRLDVQTEQRQIGFDTRESYQFYEPKTASSGSFKIEFHNMSGPTVVDLALNQRKARSLHDVVSGVPSPAALKTIYDDTRPIQWGDDLREQIQEEFGDWFAVVAEIEVLPREENQVTLSEGKTDSYGNPVPDVSWGQFGEYENNGINRAYEVMEDIIEQLDADVKQSTKGRWLNGVGHPSGTTRMGTDPNNSVVNSNLQTHDLENLFIAGSSTFVTVGASQPTLTIAALSLRLAEHINESLRE